MPGSCNDAGLNSPNPYFIQVLKDVRGINWNLPF